MTFALVAKVTIALALAVFAARIPSRASAASRHVVLMCGLLSVLWLPLANAITPILPVPVLRPATASQLRDDALLPVPAPAATPLLLPSTQARPVATTARTRPWPWMLMVWSAGAFVVASRMVWGRLLSRRLLRHCRAYTDERIVTMTRTIAHELGIARFVTLIEAPSNVMPATWGLARPVLLLPRCACEWEDGRIRLVLIHELSHVARFDALASAIAHVAMAFAWWHPLVWIASRQAQLERERACDDAVLRTGVQASEYASELLQLAQSLTPLRQATTAMAHMHGLERRVAAILDARQRRAATSRLVTTVAAVALVLQIPIAAAKLESRPVWPDLRAIESELASRAGSGSGMAREPGLPAQAGPRRPVGAPPKIRQAAVPNFGGHWRMETVPAPVEYSLSEFVAPFGDEFVATQDGRQLTVEYVPHATFSSGRASGRGSVAQVRIPDRRGTVVFQFDGEATNYGRGFGMAGAIGVGGAIIGAMRPISSGEVWDNAGWEGRTLNITSTKITNGITATSTRRLHLDGAALVVDAVEDASAASPLPRTTRYVRAAGPMPEPPNGKAVPEGRFGAGAYRPGAGIPAPYRKPPYVEPTYTDDAKRAGIEGYVEIEAVVDADGRVSEARVARSLDARFGLDDNALEVVRRSSFRPCMALGNTPLPCLVTFEVAFFLSK